MTARARARTAASGSSRGGRGPRRIAPLERHVGQLAAVVRAAKHRGRRGSCRRAPRTPLGNRSRDPSTRSEISTYLCAGDAPEQHRDVVGLERFRQPPRVALERHTVARLVERITGTSAIASRSLEADGMGGVEQAAARGDDQHAGPGAAPRVTLRRRRACRGSRARRKLNASPSGAPPHAAAAPAGTPPRDSSACAPGGRRSGRARAGRRSGWGWRSSSAGAGRMDARWARHDAIPDVAIDPVATRSRGGAIRVVGSRGPWHRAAAEVHLDRSETCVSRHPSVSPLPRRWRRCFISAEPRAATALRRAPRRRHASRSRPSPAGASGAWRPSSRACRASSP